MYVHNVKFYGWVKDREQEDVSAFILGSKLGAVSATVAEISVVHFSPARINQKQQT
jgi:hypothetical protein